MVKSTSSLLVPLALIILGFISISSFAAKPDPTTLNVMSFGAKPDGSSDSTKAFLAAWDKACSTSNPTNIIIPTGRFLVGNIVFQGNDCKKSPITFRVAGTIIAPGNYKVIASQEHWISFQDVSDVSIIGGVLDAQGTSLWKCKISNGNCPIGAKSLAFSNSNNINLFGLTSLNSQKFHIVFDSCNNVNIDGVKVSADGESPNTDGIHLERTESVRITNSRMATGDDCISMGPGTNHVFIQNIQCGPGHGISIGSLGRLDNEQGVENITVSNIDFAGTTNGVRIKTWGKDSSSYARNIVFQHINMKNVKNPIIIDQHYCLEKPCPKKESGVPVSDIRYEDIRGTSNTEVAVMLDCSKEKPCTGIVMENVNLVAVNQRAEASCVNVKGLANDVVPFAPCLKKE